MKKTTFLKLILHLYSIAISLNGFAQTLIPYRSGELWGYCTPDKKIVIPPKYEHVLWFSEGLAAVAYGCDKDCYDVYDGKWGYIDTKGNEVLPARYENACPFYKGLAWVQTEKGVWQQINKNGEVKYAHAESACIGCIPNELVEKISKTEIAIPKRYQRKYSPPDCDSWDCYQGYYDSLKGIEYWDDPETVYFLPIQKIVEDKGTHPYLVIDDNNLNRGVKLKPSIVYITSENGEIKAEKNFRLGEEDDSEENYVKINIPDFEKLKPYIQLTNENPDKAKLLFAVSVKIPTESLKNNIFFNIISRGIDFHELEYGITLFGHYNKLLYMTKPSWQSDRLRSMMYEIRKVGTALKEQGDSQNRMIQGNDNPYSGKMLFDVMEQATENDVMEFLKYVAARPFIYMGKSHALAEAFATWVDGGAPRVVSK